MKVHTLSFRRRFLRLVIFTGMCIILLSIVHVAAQADTLRVLRVLQNENNTDVVAVVVSGIFQENDLVNVYTNDSFIKAKIITAGEAGTDVAELQVQNISADVFVNGDNTITARLERRGVVEEQSPPFLLRVRNTPSQPSVTVTVDSVAGLYTPVVRGDFEVGDIIVVFLNGDEVRTKELVDAPEGDSVGMLPLAREELARGENTFAAVVRRGSAVSHRGVISSPVVVEEEPAEPEPEEEEEPEEEPEPAPEPEIGPACVDYTMTHKLFEESNVNHLHFGRNVAVSGNTLAVTTDRNQTLLYHRSDDDTWSRPQVIQGREYGGTGAARISLAMGDGTVTVGMPHAGVHGVHSGAVYEYHRPTVFGWIARDSFIPAFLDSYNLFGMSIARNDSTLAVGAEERDRSGSVYVYGRIPGGRWGVPVRLIPYDSGRNKLFGYRIAMSGPHIAVGAPGDTEAGFGAGAVYIYTLTDGSWSVKKILPDGHTASTFGREIALHDGTLFVGAERNGSDGAVYVYTDDGSEWNLTQTIEPSPDDGAGLFGASLAYARGILAVGAPNSSDGEYRTGAVFTFVREGDVWRKQEKILPAGAGNGDKIGGTVSFDGTRIAVAAHRDDAGGLNAGAVYMYRAEPVVCEEEPAEPADTDGDNSERGTIAVLTEQALLLEELFESVNAIIGNLEDDYQRALEERKQKEDRVVVFDRGSVRADAQRRAAEIRRLIGPGLPGEVLLEVSAADDPPAEEPARSRSEVVEETRDDLGVVVPTDTRVLGIGDEDEEVYRLQTFLNENGYTVARLGPGSPGSETNIFDAATERALESFQLVNGIPVTGVLDKATRDVILTYVSRF